MRPRPTPLAAGIALVLLLGAADLSWSAPSEPRVASKAPASAGSVEAVEIQRFDPQFSAPMIQYRSPERTPEAGDHVDPSKARTIRVTGRAGYRRPDGAFVGLPYAPITAFDDDGGSIGSGYEYLAFSEADALGYFDFDFLWDPNFWNDQQPDIYLTFSLDGMGFTCLTYLTTGTWDDYPGTHLDVGWQEPQSELDLPIAHRYTAIRRAERWLIDRGYTGGEHLMVRDGVRTEFEYDDPILIVFLYTHFLNVAPEDEWREDKIIAGYMHHFMARFGTLHLQSACNGVCDTGECGFCTWCKESVSQSWNWGFGLGMAAVMFEEWPSVYGLAPYDAEPLESLSSCPTLPDQPELTPGFLGAFILDLVDAANDDHPQYPGVSDATTFDPVDILECVRLDTPPATVSFVNSFKARYPASAEQIWFSAANCGLGFDFFGPGAPSALSSPSHPVGSSSTDTTVELSWVAAVDDCSGVAGYALDVNPSPDFPPQIQNVGRVTGTITMSIPPGTWYISLRAVDRAGNWGLGYATYGPITIYDPTPANLAHEQQAGWYDIVVPRSFTGSTPTNVPFPSALTGEANSFWNVVVKNVGGVPTGGSSVVRVYVDGRSYLDLFDPNAGAVTVGSINGNKTVPVINQGPIVVPPGRHMFGVKFDWLEQIAELDELDNGWSRQWIWAPSTMGVDQNLGRGAVPDRDGGYEWNGGASLWPNCDGLRFYSSGYWNAVAMFPNDAAADFDLRLFPDSSDPINGYALPWGFSARPAGCLDAVIVNINQTGAAENWDVGVTQADFEPAAGGYGYRHVISELIPFGTDHVDQLDGYEALHLKEFYVGPTTTGPVSLVLDVDPADGPVQLAWLDASFSTGALLEYSGHAATDEYGRARIDVTIPTDGYNCAVVFRDARDGPYADVIPYTLRIETTPPDLAPYKPSGWDAPLVPSALPDGNASNVLEPLQLIGWWPSTYFNLAQINQGPSAAAGPVVASIRVDDVEILSMPAPGGVAANSPYLINNAGVVPVPAGRHTISLHADDPDDVAEIDERNNVYGAQYAWSSYSIGFTPVTGMPQPAARAAGWEHMSPTALKWYNSNGWRTPSIDPAASDIYWMAVAVAPAAGGDVDLRLHLPNDDPLTAYANSIAYSGWGPGLTDYVLVNYNLAAAGAYDLGVLGLSGDSGYQYHVETAEFLGAGEGSHGPFTLESEALIGLHEVWLLAGYYSIQLENLSTVNLGVAVHGPDLAYQGKSDAVEGGIAWMEPAGNDEWISFEVANSGLHCLSVFKHGVADAPESADYELHFSAVTAAEETPSTTRTAIRSVAPNPFNPRTEIRFSLQESGPAGVVVYNLRGEKVRTLVRRSMEAGEHRIVWNGKDEDGRAVASGVYVVELQMDGVRDRRKMSLLK